MTWRLGSGGVGVSLLTGGLGIKDGTCFSMIVSFMARGMVWEVREKVGNSYFIRKGPYECQIHMSTRTRDEKSVLTGRYKLKFCKGVCCTTTSSDRHVFTRRVSRDAT